MRWAAFAVVIAALEGSAHAANVVASVDDDVDGDGKADHVSLSGDGVLHIDATRTTTVKVSGAVTVAKIGVSHPRTGPLIVVDLVHEAVVVGSAGGAWRELTRFPIGEVGIDAEYAIAVDAAATGVIRYQTGRVHRCDGRPAYLFAGGYNPTTNQFAPMQPPVDVPATASTLSVRVDSDPAQPPVIFQARAASTEAGAGNASGLSLPRELDDGKLDTSWREDLASDGKGQVFTFESGVASFTDAVTMSPRRA